MENTKYTCPYCGTEHNEPSKMAHCILSCEKKETEKAEKKRKKELAEQKEKRRDEIEKQLEKTNKMIKEYLTDYGEYAIRVDKPMPYLWHMFL
jgi:hypothetical protein